MPKSRILVIDDEAAIRDSLRMTLEYEGYEFVGAATGQEGLALAEREAPDLVLLDVKMPGMDGMEVLDRLRAMNETLPVVDDLGPRHDQHGGRGDQEGRVRLPREAVREHRTRARDLSNALEQGRLRDENRTLKKAVEVRHQMVGESAALKQVMAAVGRAAPTNATVLIQGESGVGKELVARTIHRNSLRSRERFVQVNCAAIPEELIESELFGHEKGSFTGATEKQVGKFEQADRGHDLPRRSRRHERQDAGQGAARAAGGRGRAARVGAHDQGGRPRHRRDQQEPRGGDREGHFREDLYFRLAVIPIHVPPLRERPEDIPLLVRHYMDYFSRENNARPKRITPAALEALQRYRWKGNIRELRNTVERLIIMTGGDTIDVGRSARTPSRSPSAAGRRRARARPLERRCGEGGDAARVQGQVRAGVSGGKLRENGWNISKTAEVIDTPRSNLYKKLEQYQISQETDG